MNLIQIYSISSLMEIIFSIIAAVCVIVTVTIIIWFDAYGTRKNIIKWTAVGLATAMFLVCICMVYNTPSTNVYSYYVTNQTELSQAIDNGYSIHLSDGNVYDLIKEVK